MKKIILIFIITLSAVTLSAQQKEGQSAQAGSNTTFVDNGFWDNWLSEPEPGQISISETKM
jgi:hypothetical protein